MSDVLIITGFHDKLETDSPVISILNYSKIYAASFGLAMIMFLWPMQISVSDSGIPIYIPISLFLLLVSNIDYKYIFVFLLFFCILVFLSLLQCLQGVSFTTPIRSLLSIPIFCFVVSCAYRWIALAEKNNFLIFFKIAKLFLLLQCVLQVAQVVLFELGMFETHYQHLFGFPRCSGFFEEPSHVAYGLSPFLFLFCFYNKLFFAWMGRKEAILIFCIFALSPSSTLVAVFMIIVCFLLIRSCNSLKSFLRIIFPILLLSFCIFVALFQVPATSERFFNLVNVFFDPSIIQASDNLSALMFLKGFQMAFASLQNFPFGSGFLNFQFLNDYSSVSMLSDMHYVMNMHDGTSVGFKLVGEYGYIGLLLIFYLICAFLKNIRKTNIKLVFQNMCFFGVIVCCVRGGSYFDGSPVFFFAYVFLNLFKRYRIPYVANRMELFQHKNKVNLSV
ncbi:hypothetical protein ACTVJH_06205 [Desulfoplanes sp. PS50]